VTSTALDAALCLLLVSGGVVVLSGATPAVRETGTGADAAVETLSTTTATLPVARDGERDARRHATLAGHVAVATLSAVELGGRPVTGGRGEYVAAVEGAVRTALGSNVQLVAVWRPYPEAPLWGRFVVGPAPPPGATVHAETTRVPSGVPPVRDAADLDSTSRFGGRVADVVVAGLFPADELAYALDDPAVAPLVRDRYARAGDALGVPTPRDATSDHVPVLNDRLAAELESRFVQDIGERSGGAGAVNEDVSTETVLVTVRTWS
jgi:hypothetical protein